MRVGKTQSQIVKASWCLVKAARCESYREATRALDSPVVDETGRRKPSLELLLPLTEAHQVPLDELVGAPEVGDPRIRLKPRNRKGRLVFPLTQQSSGVQVWKVVIPPERERELRVHEGYEWLYVLSGRLRLILGEHDITLAPGEVAEFDTRMPHWFGPAGDDPVEILSIHAHHGRRMQVRAAPRRTTRKA